MIQQEILSLNTTKTHKIKLLLQTGLTRRQVAEIMQVGYGFVQNVYAKHFATKTNTNDINFALMPFERKFGVEIEGFLTGNKTKYQLAVFLQKKGINCKIEYQSYTVRKHWKITSDSSIVADGETFEIVSPILQGENGLEQIERVCQALKEFGARINRTCGLHVHFDASNFDLTTWKNLLINYANMEITIDKFMPESRRANKNEYCQSIRKNITDIKKIQHLNQISTLFGDRYKKINTESFARHRTVEFRHHNGTIEFEKIKNWILFLHNLVEVSKIKILNNVNLEGLAEFNPQEIVNFYAERTEELN